MKIINLLLTLILIKQAASESVVVFRRGEGGYSCIKIPSILTTSRGTLLAFGEARVHSCSDYAQTDLVYKRSTDAGRTWSRMRVLVKANNSSNFTRVGNIAPVQLKTSNRRILAPFCRDNLIVMQTYSDDDGVTFSTPVVVPNVTRPDWKWVGLGPPAGLLLQSNRILIPAYYSTRPNDNGLLSTGYVMLNDHDGRADKWYVGGEFRDEFYFPNECQAVELKNNSVLVNARTLDTKRVSAHSDDGGVSFRGRVDTFATLVQPITGCQGSMVFQTSSQLLFYSGLDTKSLVRSNLSLYVSKDYGKSWILVKTVFSGSSSYSALTLLDENKIGLLYEWANKTDLIFNPDYISYTVVY